MHLRPPRGAPGGGRIRTVRTVREAKTADEVVAVRLRSVLAGNAVRGAGAASPAPSRPRGESPFDSRGNDGTEGTPVLPGVGAFGGVGRFDGGGGSGGGRFDDGGGSGVGGSSGG